MVASTGLVFGHNDEEPHPLRLVHVSVPVVADRPGYLAEGFTIMAYAEAVKHNAHELARQELVRQDSERQARPSLYVGVGREEPVASFIRGWRAAGGVEAWLEYVLNVVVTCESEWNVYAVSPNGLYHGLGQWHWATWSATARQTGLWDIWDPEHQGHNMAYKSQREGGGAWGCW